MINRECCDDFACRGCSKKDCSDCENRHPSECRHFGAHELRGGCKMPCHKTGRACVDMTITKKEPGLPVGLVACWECSKLLNMPAYHLPPIHEPKPE